MQIWPQSINEEMALSGCAMESNIRSDVHDPKASTVTDRAGMSDHPPGFPLSMDCHGPVGWVVRMGSCSIEYN